MTEEKYIPMLIEWHSSNIRKDQEKILLDFFLNKIGQFDESPLTTVTFNTKDYPHLRNAELGNFEVLMQRYFKKGNAKDFPEWRGLFTRNEQHLLATGLYDWE